MIRLINISKSYDNRIKAVDDVTLDIQPGEIFGFLGPNGAGKTTSIKMMTGILEIDRGDIKIGDLSIKTDPIKYKQKFGFVPDSPDMFLKLKGIEYLNFIGAVYRVNLQERRERIKRLATDFGIYDNLNQLIESFSHGMRQKLVIIGALISNPDVWILDEPLTGLDPKSAFILKQMMHEHTRAGKTVFFSTHVLEVAEKLCDRIGIINKGKLIFVGTIDKLKEKKDENETLESLFLQLVENG